MLHSSGSLFYALRLRIATLTWCGTKNCSFLPQKNEKSKEDVDFHNMGPYHFELPVSIKRGPFVKMSHQSQ